MTIGNFAITIEKPADIEGLKREDVAKALVERSEVLDTVFREAGEKMDPAAVKVTEFKDGSEMAVFIRKMNEELSALGKRQTMFDEAAMASKTSTYWQDYLKQANGPRAIDFAPQQQKRQEVFELPWAYKALYEKDGKASPILEAMRSKQTATFELEDADPGVFLNGKAVFATTAGWAPQSSRTGKLVLSAQQEIEVTDILPMLPTSQAAIVYMEETTFTNAAAARNEGAAYAEGTLALTERSETVRSVGVSLPVTDEQLADIDGARAYLDARLGFMVRQRVDAFVLGGTGIAPQPRGTLNVVGINTQAKGADPVPDAIYKGIKACRITGRSQPNVVIIHPNDWEGVRLLRTADGIYIWGNPSEAGPARIWGLPVIETTAATENTAVTGDYANFSALYMRQGLELQTGYVNDDFLNGRVTIRAGLRLAIVHFRPAAFCTITGI